MKTVFPIPELAKAGLEGYAEDGVRGIVYEENGSWVLELNDEDYNEYSRKMEQRKSEVRDEFCEEWEGVNRQSFSTEGPSPEQDRIGLYLIHPGCRTVKGFKFSGSIKDLIERRTSFVTAGSKCAVCRHSILIVLRWEDIRPRRS